MPLTVAEQNQQDTMLKAIADLSKELHEHRISYEQRHGLLDLKIAVIQQSLDGLAWERKKFIGTVSLAMVSVVAALATTVWNFFLGVKKP